MTSRPDTGHPFGFYRVLVHDDGHAGIISCYRTGNKIVEAHARLLTEFGLTTFKLAWLPPEQATAAYTAGLGCERCQVRLSCGCDLIQDVLTGQCAHGTRKAIQAAAARCGFLEDVPQPAGINAIAEALVAEAVVAGGTRRHGRKPAR